MGKRYLFVIDLKKYNYTNIFEFKDDKECEQIIGEIINRKIDELKILEITDIKLVIDDDGFELNCKICNEPYRIDEELKVIEILKSVTNTEFVFKVLEASGN